MPPRKFLQNKTQADRRGAEQHQELLIAELNHRVRNILGLVRGLITQSVVTIPIVTPPPMASRRISADTGLQQKICLRALVLGFGRGTAPLPRAAQDRAIHKKMQIRGALSRRAKALTSAFGLTEDAHGVDQFTRCQSGGSYAANSSSSAFASFRSRVSKPSVSSRACCTLPWSRQRRASKLTALSPTLSWQLPSSLSHPG